MRKFGAALLMLIMLLTSFGFFGCGSAAVNDDEVVLVNLDGRTTYNLIDAMSPAGADAVSGRDDVVYTLKSVATNTVFTVTDPVLNFEELHKEYFLVTAKVNESVIYTGKFDFHDYNNEGVVWCEMSEYTIGAVRSDAVSTVVYDEVYEEFAEGYILSAQPDNPRYWRFAYYAIMPFHSKEYYLQYTDISTMLKISYVRKAIYHEDSWNFNPDRHQHGMYVNPGSLLNVRYFGCGGNVQSTGALLNIEQSLEFRMVDILEYFDVLGNPKHPRASENGKARWYLVGTCHDKGNPYQITYYFNYIDVLAD